MLQKNKKTLIVLTGPTASGKSTLAIDLCLHFGCRLISADSRQIYRHIPIVTAMPSQHDRALVEHRLIDCLELDSYYSASCFEQDALRLINEDFKKSDYALVCGGSMLYVDALCNGIDELPTVADDIRSDLMLRHAQNGDSWLFEQLQELDPETALKIDKNNIKRVFHAVEVSIAAGKPYSSLLTGKRIRRDFNIVKLMLDAPRATLFERINKRVLDMLESGLEQEARSVYPLRGLNSLNTVGLKEMFAYFDGIMTKDEAVARIQKNTRVYAKKQLTWFARDNEIIRLDITKPDLADRAVKVITDRNG